MPTASRRVPRLAIACQGGGAHTAFTAGVLAYLFLSFEHFRSQGEEGRWFELVGLSGTSGGAITAAMAWSEAPDGSWAEGARRVLHYWNRNKASLDPRGKLPLWWGEYFTNAATQWASAWQNWLPAVLAASRRSSCLLPSSTWWQGMCPCVLASRGPTLLW